MVVLSGTKESPRRSPFAQVVVIFSLCSIQDTGLRNSLSEQTCRIDLGKWLPSVAFQSEAGEHSRPSSLPWLEDCSKHYCGALCQK